MASGLAATSSFFVLLNGFLDDLNAFVESLRFPLGTFLDGATISLMAEAKDLGSFAVRGLVLS